MILIENDINVSKWKCTCGKIIYSGGLYSSIITASEPILGEIIFAKINYDILSIKKIRNIKRTNKYINC